MIQKLSVIHHKVSNDINIYLKQLNEKKPICGKSILIGGVGEML
jgi:hypothetical protein